MHLFDLYEDVWYCQLNNDNMHLFVLYKYVSLCQLSNNNMRWWT